MSAQPETNHYSCPSGRRGVKGGTDTHTHIWGEISVKITHTNVDFLFGYTFFIWVPSSHFGYTLFLFGYTLF